MPGEESYAVRHVWLKSSYSLLRLRWIFFSACVSFIRLACCIWLLYSLSFALSVFLGLSLLSLFRDPPERERLPLVVNLICPLSSDETFDACYCWWWLSLRETLEESGPSIKSWVDALFPIKFACR